MSDKNPAPEQVDEWLAEEQWHRENATVDMSVLMQPLTAGADVPAVALYDATGASFRLSSLWSEKPALLITGSLTCPPSRRLCAVANELQAAHPELNVAIIYVIDAHPTGSPCPYTGTDWPGRDNLAEGVCYPQPATLPDRLGLAAQFVETLEITVPVFIDNMENETWHALGRAPNAAVLVGTDGCCLAGQVWFRPDDIGTLISAVLASD